MTSNLTTKIPAFFGYFFGCLARPEICHPSGWMAAPESSGYLDLDFFKFGMKKLGGEKLGFVAQICHKGRLVKISQRFFCEGS